MRNTSGARMIIAARLGNIIKALKISVKFQIKPGAAKEPQNAAKQNKILYRTIIFLLFVIPKRAFSP